LRDLVDRTLEAADYRTGIRYASRLLEMDPLLEETHRQLMRLLAYDGQRGAALNQYEACRAILDRELGVEPDEATAQLYEEIQAGDLADVRLRAARPVAVPASQPGFLTAPPAKPERPVFVERESELARLDRFLQAAGEGHGGVVLVSGGPGVGKSALLQEFGRRAMGADPQLLVASCSCNAYSGVGDPYLPFREIMSMLTGDVEGRWAAGSISSEHARRLWNALPTVGQALMEDGPDLPGVLVGERALFARGAAAASGQPEWLRWLGERLEREPARAEGLRQDHLFDQLTRTLHRLAEKHSLLLILDDLQWADSASTGLLFHLGRRLQGSRILIAGAYRPEEVAIHPEEGRQPLEKLLHEFKRQYGDVWLDLDRIGELENRRFVDALLDTEPNRLPNRFRDQLFQHTAGHPLFTIELLRTMQERGDLVSDHAGQWMEGAGLDWHTLPPRVEGVIEERVERLDRESRELLSVAAVEGSRFAVQVLARVRGTGERQVGQILARELEQRHRLVVEDGIESLNGHTHYFRFQHVMFQQYVYDRLSAVERELLHGEVARVLEELCHDEPERMAVELGRHWLQAANEERALPYLLKAGDQARAVYAHEEAESYYRQAIEILRSQGKDEPAARTLMKLALVYTAGFRSAEAQQAYQEAFALWEPLRHTASHQPQRPSGQVLRFAVERPPALDPGLAGDDMSVFLAAQLFEGLVRIGEDHNVLPALAQRWQVLDGGSRYVFTLRPGASWSDGSPLTAADFAYAWKRNLTPSTGSPVAHLLFPVRNAGAFNEGHLDEPDEVGVTGLDERTLEVRLEGPSAYLPYLLAYPVAYPLPRWAVEGHDEDWMAASTRVTNGPFLLAEWIPGESMLLTRNPHYGGPVPGNVERVECSCYSDYDAALGAYEVDRVDAVSLFNADSATVARARAAYGHELVFFPQPVTFFLLFRADRRPFDDARVRRAFALALDRRALARDALQDPRLPATGGFVPPGMAGHSPDIGLPYDPREARRLLSEAGYPDGRGFPPVTWLHTTRSEGDRTVPFLQRSLHENLNLDLRADTLPWGPFLERVGHDPAHLTLLGYGADYPDPDSMLRVTFHSSTGTSTAGWKHSRFDALVETAAQTVDHAKRMQLYREADRILVAEEAAVVPLSYGRGRILAKPWVSLPRTLSTSMPLKNIVVNQSS
jgi:ABC-type oligopeptide transport system substrate-binding subunit